MNRLAKQFKVVPAFGKDKGKGFIVLLFKRSDNMTIGSMDEVFPTEDAAAKAAIQKGLTNRE